MSSAAKDVGALFMPEPKHRQIFTYLERGIRSGRFPVGEQLPTEHALVEKFGVSRPTVSRAMLDLTNMGLVERRPGAGSFVVERRTKRAQRVLGLVVPELGLGDVFDPICAQIVRRSQQLELGLIMGDAGADHSPVRDGLGRLSVSTDDAERACDTFARHQVAGVFFTPIAGATGDAETTNHRILTKLQRAGIVVVLIDRDVTYFPRRSRFDLVSVDHTLGQYLATQHLVDGGWRRIAYLQWPGISDSLNKRVAGYRAVLSESTDRVAPDHVVAGDPRDASFVLSLMNGLKPDAFLCENDLIATHLMQTLGKLGHAVPRDVGVVGFNDTGLAQHLETPLTSVRQPCQEIGKAAVDLMVWRLDNRESAARTLLLNPELIVRASSMKTA